MMSEFRQVLVSDLIELGQYLGECDHWDHHGYCQTHGLGEAVQLEPMACAIGRVARLGIMLEGEQT